MKCTCHIIEGHEEIVHQKCPLCKAAPELLEDLRFIHTIAKARNSDAAWRDIEMVTANAIAKAEGR